MTIQEYMAAQAERTAEGLAHFVATTDPGRLHWQPQIEGSAPTRSVLEQVAECVDVNRRIAGLLRGQAVGAPGAAASSTVLQTAGEAQEQIVASGADLAAAIRAMSDADLDRTFETPRGKFTGANFIMMPLRNMGYHSGQINLIQMFAGDAEFHIPPRWRE